MYSRDIAISPSKATSSLTDKSYAKDGRQMVSSLTKAEEQKVRLEYPESQCDASKLDSFPQAWGEHGEHVLVGQGPVTNPCKCGKFGGFFGCLHIENHDVTTLDGHNHSGEVYVRKFFHSCDKPTCSVCFKRGWCVREAGNIESRLKEASRRFGQIEHIFLSVGASDHELPFDKLKVKAINALRRRGIHGGCIIFHAFRYADYQEHLEKGVPFGWYFSPHFHILGFVEGGYGRCRSCKRSWLDCAACNGFKGLTRRCYEKDECIVDVLGKRKSVFGTAWYQLNHMSIRKGKERTHTVTWFGTCSYRRLKLKKADRIRRDVCPICGSDLIRVRYVGGGDPLAEWWVDEFWESLFDDRETPKWIEAG
jgi:hypothetical protein